VVLTPSLPLREAVALSRDLAGDGLQVQVRRASGPSTSPPAGPAATAPEDTLYRVRVGSFPDRASAQATLRELEAKGYKAFLTRGAP
jgi:cell division septation protein DedD